MKIRTWKYPQSFLPIRVKFYLSKELRDYDSSIAAFKIIQNVDPHTELVKSSQAEPVKGGYGRKDLGNSSLI